jgi:hypothetical protein
MYVLFRVPFVIPLTGRWRILKMPALYNLEIIALDILL